jgi:hypothetical protein
MEHRRGFIQRLLAIAGAPALLAALPGATAASAPASAPVEKLHMGDDGPTLSIRGMDGAWDSIGKIEIVSFSFYGKPRLLLELVSAPQDGLRFMLISQQLRTYRISGLPEGDEYSGDAYVTFYSVTSCRYGRFTSSLELTPPNGYSFAELERTT